MRKRIWAAFLSVVLLPSCGGGGGGSDSEPLATPVKDFPVASVIARLIEKGGAFTGSYLSSRGTLSTLNLSYVPRPDGWLSREEAVSPQVVTGRIIQSNTQFRDTSAGLGAVGWSDDRGNIADLRQSSPLPPTASAGTGGNVFSADLLIQNNALNDADIGLTHKLSYDWTVSAVTDSTADLCLIFTETTDFQNATRLDCFRIDNIGQILGFQAIYRYQMKSIGDEAVYR